MSLYVRDMDVTAAGPKLRLRLDVFDETVAERRISTRAEQEATLGLTRRTISRLRKGHQPSFATAVRVADALGVPLMALFERVEEREAS